MKECNDLKWLVAIGNVSNKINKINNNKTSLLFMWFKIIQRTATS